MAKSKAPSSAKETVQAMGLNRSPFYALQSENREIASDDDETREDHRPLDFMCGAADYPHGRHRPALAAHLANDVFHDDYGAVHHHSEIERS